MHKKKEFLGFRDNTIFNSVTYGQLPLRSVIWKILSYISSDPEARYRIAVGTDSMTKKKYGTRFAVAITVHKIGKGSIYFYKVINTKPITDLHYKLCKETEMSIQVAEYLTRAFGEVILKEENPVHLVLHMDVGENGQTSNFINELENYVGGRYTCQIKPDSYASSFVADRYTKH